ncbi:uncharacterized protein LOC122063782 isoform X1 [Macadamia integrifolia]|uniref:uncharacterized protein LOC122063782 isoform X1 n=1 Tax=Macadamia integrifolia TaxID=60698 RepID=UPI001C4F3786|nr:uncharacterized protein LOC122063782 isoform X1 [Macadamia integrifolia]
MRMQVRQLKNSGSDDERSRGGTCGDSWSRLLHPFIFGCGFGCTFCIDLFPSIFDLMKKTFSFPCWFSGFGSFGMNLVSLSWFSPLYMILYVLIIVLNWDGLIVRFSGFTSFAIIRMKGKLKTPAISRASPWRESDTEIMKRYTCEERGIFGIIR